MTSANKCRQYVHLLMPFLAQVTLQICNQLLNQNLLHRDWRQRERMVLLSGIRSRKVYSAITNVHSATVMTKTFAARVMGFGFNEMAKSTAKNLSTGFGGSQHERESQNPLTQQLSERMELQETKSLARQSTEKQSEGSQSESRVKIGLESEELSAKSNCKQQEIEWNKVMRMWEAHSEGHNRLSNEQMTVLNAVSRGESVFLTGCAGTGKTYLLNFVVKILKELHGPGSVFVTASTGIAACHLNGMCLRAFAGASPFDVTKQGLLRRIEKKDRYVSRWKNAKAVVIDEISMIDGKFFDQLNYVANKLRQPLKGKGVWGGLQLVVSGDFFQLPPVTRQNTDKFFAFEADCWNECFDKQIELTHVYRQSDRELVEILQEIRRGEVHPKTLAKLKNCQGPTVDEPVIRLYTRNYDVRRVNDGRLNSLGQEIITFIAEDEGEVYAKRNLKTGIAPYYIGLCIGAQVMLIKNIETGIGLLSGLMGQIVDFVRDDTQSRAISPTRLWPKVRFLCGVERIITPESWHVYEGEVKVATRTQVPLILAWAITVHKCQGMTLERLETNLSKAFDYGMEYVALSRVKSLDGLRFTGLKPSKIKAHPKVLDFYQKLTSSGGLHG